MDRRPDPTARSRDLLRPLTRVRRRVLAHRRLLAALAAGVATYAAVLAASAPPAPTVPVWTAARDLPSGHRIGPGDLTRVGFSRASVPADRVTDPARVLGRVVGAPLGRGEAVAEHDVVGNAVAARRPGLTAVPVRLSDPAVVALLRPGDRVDLVSADPAEPDTTTRLASAAEVLAVPETAPGGEDGSLPGRLVVLGVGDDAAVRVAGEAASHYLTVLWSR